MNTLTFNFKSRSKTFTHETVEGAYELFLIGYGEVLDELVDVDILEIDDKGQEHELSMTADTFRTKFSHVEDKVGDKMTELMTNENNAINYSYHQQTKENIDKRKKKGGA